MKEFKARKSKVIQPTNRNIQMKGSLWYFGECTHSHYREYDLAVLQAQQGRTAVDTVTEAEEDQDEKPESIQVLKLGFDFLMDQDLLYHPFDVYTPQRKITQIHLLNFLIYEMKQEFNKEIRHFVEMKKSEIQKIEEKNARIAEIAAELKEDIPLFHPELDEDELPESVFTVKESEMTSVRMLTQEEQEAVQQQQKEKEKAMEKRNESAERGLKVMMGGVLEVSSP